MIRWRIGTLEEISKAMNFAYNENSFPSQIYDMLGKFVNDLNELNNTDKINHCLNIGINPSVYSQFNVSYDLPHRWFTKVFTGIELKLVIVDGQSVKKGDVFMFKNKARYIESITKIGSVITINNEFDVNNIELIDPSLITDIM